MIGGAALGAYTVAANYAQLIRQTNATGVFLPLPGGGGGGAALRKNSIRSAPAPITKLGDQKAGAAREFIGSLDKLRIAEVNLRVLLNYPRAEVDR